MRCCCPPTCAIFRRSEEHTSELQSRFDVVCRLLLEKTKVDQMGLKHVVITSVDRDDLPYGGAEVFAACIAEIRRRVPETSVEVLIPDFKGNPEALRIVVAARPDILNHNLETIARLYRIARPGGRYPRALELLERAKDLNSEMLTKSGIICGLGEEWDELLVAMRDLRAARVDILTIGQYLRPSDQHL